MANHLKQVNQTTSVRTLLETLKNKIQDFTVIDKQGQRVGMVKDIILNANRRLNLVISQHKNQPLVNDRHRLFLLWSQMINKIDNHAKSVFIDLDKSEIEFMPEYLETEKPGLQSISDNSTNLNMNSPTNQNKVESISEKINEENVIRLIEERLIADSSKHKIGEVIVRKKIETRIVQVPVRREKLIVEQVSPENKQLVEIDLGQGEISGWELITEERPEEEIIDGSLTVSGVFSSPKIASLLLNAIALEHHHGCQQVKITMAVADQPLQKKYQEWFERCSQSPKHQTEK